MHEIYSMSCRFQALISLYKDFGALHAWLVALGLIIVLRSMHSKLPNLSQDLILNMHVCQTWYWCYYPCIPSCQPYHLCNMIMVLGMYARRHEKILEMQSSQPWIYTIHDFHICVRKHVSLNCVTQYLK